MTKSEVSITRPSPHLQTPMTAGLKKFTAVQKAIAWSKNQLLKPQKYTRS